MGLIELLRRLLGSPSVPPPSVPPPPLPPPPVGSSRTAPGVLDILDRHRARPLAWDAGLANAALAHSRDMAARRRLGHDGSDGSTFDRRARRHAPAVTPLGECVGAGQHDERTIVADWYRSSGHRAILLDDRATRAGVAVAVASDGTPYWTAVTGA